MTVTIDNVTIHGDGTATWSGSLPSIIGTQPVWVPPLAPDAPVSGSERPDLIRHQFADGYTRRAPKGLNHMALQLSITFSNIYAAEKDEILQFLRARGGYQPFWWQQPNEALRRWVAPEWSLEQQGFDRWRVSVRLERDWAPAT